MQSPQSGIDAPLHILIARPAPKMESVFLWRDILEGEPQHRPSVLNGIAPAASRRRGMNEADCGLGFRKPVCDQHERQADPRPGDQPGLLIVGVLDSNEFTVSDTNGAEGFLPAAVSHLPDAAPADALDTLVLGLDVGDLDRVVQIDAPPTVSSFLQRMGRTGRRAGTTSNCLFLATSDEGLLRAAALLNLWRDGFVEPVEAPPEPFHILAQQLMALVLQEGGVGRSDWFDWVSTVPAFGTMPRSAVSDLVDHMVRTRVLWDDHGLLSFAPEGEAEYGRQNFMDLLSVFTSPPLFRVISGQTELGFVHESTFYKRDDGPPVLVLAGRSWRAKNVDWRRRIAHVEPAEERGRSRWLGEGQFLSHRVCRSIQRLLAADTDQPVWSKRATAQMTEIRSEYTWASEDGTSIVRHPNGEIRWWTFAGGVANTLLADHIRPRCEAKADNLALRFSSTATLSEVEAVVRSLSVTEVQPVPQADALENLKFSECLPPDIAARVFAARYQDREAICRVVAEPAQVLSVE